MASPFPGMDPYLEGSLWSSVHTMLCAEIARQLNPKLRPKYAALSTRRFVLDSLDDVEITRSNIYPDVVVVESEAGAPRRERAEETTATLELATVITSTVPVITVEIRDVRNRDLITAIEVLSPVNKRGSGRAEYICKRQGVLSSTAHLLEIDLLRAGQRVPMLEPLPPVPYFVLLHRVEKGLLMDVWPITLRQPLPIVNVPLLPGDADVLLDLQQALTNVYDESSLDLMVNYAEPPEVPLSAEDSAWAEERLRAAGLRD